MRRVSVVGNSDSGKSTLGRALATALGVPFVELDSIFHQAGWMSLPAWTRHALYRTTLMAAAAAAATGHENGHLRFVRIRSRADARQLLAEAAPRTAGELP